MSLRKGEIKLCKACETPFYIPSYRINTAKFCSHFCQNKKQYERVKYVCGGCEQEFETSPSKTKKKFCSMDCKIKCSLNIKERRKRQKIASIKNRGYIKGKNLKKQLSKIVELKCNYCGYNEYDFCLDVHHIDENPLNNDLTNLAILCVICHRKLHKGVIDASKIKSTNEINGSNCRRKEN